MRNTRLWVFCAAMQLMLMRFHNLASQHNRLEFSTFGVNDGLSQGNVTCMMQDHLGMMWFGTWDGINVYDGFKNNTFSKPISNSVGIRGVVINNILELDSNRVAVSTFAGLAIFYRNQQRFTFYKDTTPFLNCRMVSKAGNALILSSSNILRKFDLNTLAFQGFESDHVSAWKQAMNQRKNGVNRSEFLFTRVFDLFDAYPSVFQKLAGVWDSLTVNDVDWNPGMGKLFLGCDEGLFMLDTKLGAIRKLAVNESVKCLYSSQNQLFVGTQIAGLFVVAKDNERILANYRHSEISRRSLTGNYIRSLYIDTDLNLWLSVLGGGVNYCSLKRKPARTLFSSADLSPGNIQDNYIQSVAEDSTGKLWLFTVAGTLKILNNGYETESTFLPAQIDPVRKPVSVQYIHISKTGRKYLLSNKGLYWTEDNLRFNRVPQTVEDEDKCYLQHMAEVEPGHYLVASRGGLFWFHESSNLITPASHASTDHEIIHFVFPDPAGRIYVSRFYKGIVIFERQAGQLKKVGTIPTQANLKACADGGSEWLFATTKGILRVDKHRLSYRFVQERNGLPNQNTYALLPDPTTKGAWWCSSNKGIFRYQLSTGRFLTLGLQDGLSSLEFNTLSFAKRKNGDFVFGSIDGLTVVNPTQIKDYEQPRPLIITGFEIDGLADTATAYIMAGKSIGLPYSQNGFSCRLVQVRFPNFETPVRYRLAGHDRAWNKGATPLEIRYSNLHEGKYELMVQYYNRQKGWINQSVFRIVVYPPWYRTWWAIVCYVAGTVAAIVMGIQFYIARKLRAQHEELTKKELLINERTRIVSDLHDDVGSALSSIQIYSKVAESLLATDPGRTAVILQQIRTSSESSINNLSDIVWALKSDQPGATIENRVRTFCADLLEPKEIAVSYKFEVDPDSVFTRADQRKNALLLMKEALNNIAKYSQATEVTIQLVKQNQSMVLVIHDNGVGFKPGQTQGNGLYTMKERATHLGGILSVLSEPGGGTTIQVSWAT